MGARDEGGRRSVGAGGGPAGGGRSGRAAHGRGPGCSGGRQTVNGFLRAAAVARKDLLMEWRGRQTITPTCLVAVLMIFLLRFLLGAEPARAAAVLLAAPGVSAVRRRSPRNPPEGRRQGARATLLLHS